MYPKFIIENIEGKGLCMIIAKCDYHRQLAQIESNIKGGGWWSFDKESTTFILSGESHDFGRADIEDIKKCISQNNVFLSKRLLSPMSKEYDFKFKDEVGDLFELKYK